MDNNKENFNTTINNPAVNDPDKDARDRAKFLKDLNSLQTNDAQTFGDTRDKSKYDSAPVSFRSQSEINELRGERQTLGNKWGNGLLRLSGTATTAFLEGTIGLGIGVTNAIHTGEFSGLYDHDFGRALDHINEKLSESAPIYYTQEQQDTIFNANFIPDKLFNGAGYMLGAIGAGYAGGAVLGSLGKLALANKLTPATLAAENAASGIISAAKGTSLKNGMQELFVATLAAHGESSVEARGARKATLDNLIKKFEETGQELTEDKLKELQLLADSAGNVDYLINMAIVGGTNYLQFGRLMTSGFKNNEKALYKILKNSEGKWATPALTPDGKKLRALSPYLKGMGEEAFQEGAQFGTEVSTSDYYTRKYNSESWNTLSEMLHSTKDGLVETLTSKEGIESMLLGAILGAGGGFMQNDVKQKTANTERAVELLNKHTLDSMTKKLETGARLMSYEKDKDALLSVKDVFNYKNLEFDQFKTLVQYRSEFGKFNDLLDELDGLKSYTEDKFKERFGFSKEEALPKPIPQLVEELKSKATKIKDIHEAIELEFPVNRHKELSNAEFSYLKEALFHTTTVLDNTNSRIAELKNQITNLSTPNSPIRVFDSLQAATDENYLPTYMQEVNKALEARKTLEGENSINVKNLESYSNDIVKLEERRQLFVTESNKLRDPNKVKASFSDIAVMHEMFSNRDSEVQAPTTAATTAAPTTSTVAPVTPVAGTTPGTPTVPTSGTTPGTAAGTTTPGTAAGTVTSEPLIKLKANGDFSLKRPTYTATYTIKDGKVTRLRGLLTPSGDTFKQNTKESDDAQAAAKKELEVFKTLSLQELEDLINQGKEGSNKNKKTSSTKKPTKKSAVKLEPNGEIKLTRSNYVATYIIKDGKVTRLRGLVNLEGETFTPDTPESEAAKAAAQAELEQLKKLNLSELEKLVNEGEETEEEVEREEDEKEIEEEELLPIEDDSQSPNEFNEDIQAGYTLDKTTATVRDKTTRPSRLRWLDYVDNLSKVPVGYKFKVVLSSDPEYLKIVDSVEASHTDADDISVVFLLVDKAGNPVKANDGGLLYTFPLKNETIQDGALGNKGSYSISPKHFLTHLGYSEEEAALGDKHKDFPELWKKEVERKNAFRTKLQSGLISHVPIIEKSPGHIETEGASYISPVEAFWGDFKQEAPGKAPRYYVPTSKSYNSETGKFDNYEVVDRTTNNKGGVYPFDFLGKKKVRLKVGQLYTIKDGVFYPLRSRTLNSKEVTTVKNLFAGLAKEDHTMKGDTKSVGLANRLGVISNYIFLTPSNKNYGKNNLFYDIENKVIRFGEKGSVALADVTTDAEFLEFLKQRKRQVDVNKLRANTLIATAEENGNINNAKESRVPYYQFLFETKKDETPAFSIKIKPKGERQVTNSYMVFDSANAVEGPGETIIKEETTTTPTSTETEESIDDTQEFGGIEEFVKNNKGEESPKSKSSNRLNVKGYNENKPIGGTELGGGFDRLATSKKYVKEDINAVEKWYIEKFGDKDYRLTKELIDGKAFGQFYNGIVYLYENAEEGTMYHEAFHKVSMQYLTPKQRENLYKEYREREKNSKLTNLEVEEGLAEDFRNFMLTGQKAIAGKPIRNTLFRRLFNFLKTFFTGKVNIEQVYTKLASKEGYSKSKKVNPLATEKLNRFSTFTETATIELNNHVTSLFFSKLFDGNITPAQLLQNKNQNELTHKVYTVVKNTIDAKLKAIYDANNERELTEEEINYFNDFRKVVDDYTNFVKQHKKTLTNLIQINLTQQEKESEPELNEDGTPADRELVETTREFIPADEINTINFTSNNTKLLLGSLTAMDANGIVKDSYGNPSVVGPQGMPKLYNFLLRELKGLDTMGDMFNKLHDLVELEPSVQSLINRLGTPSRLDEEGVSHYQRQLWLDFWQDFNKAEKRGTITILYANGDIAHIDANQNTVENRIKDIWKANLFQNKQYLNINGNKSTIKLAEVLKIKNNIEFLEALGIAFDNNSEESLDLPISVVSNIRRELEDALNNNVEVYDLWKDVNINTDLNTLLQISAKSNRLFVELSYQNAEDKRIYSVSLSTYFDKMANKVNNSATWEDLITAYPVFNSVSMEGSVWLDTLFPKDENGNRGERSPIKFEVTTNAGIALNNDKDAGKVISKAAVSEKFMQEFNDLLLTGRASVPRTADKSSDFAAGLISAGQPLAISLQEVADYGFKGARTQEIFTNYFLAELHRIQEFNVNKLGKNIAVYNKLAGNWSIFADILSPETKEKLKPYTEKLEDPSSELIKQVLKDVSDFFMNESVGVSKYSFGSIKNQLDEHGLKAGEGIAANLVQKHSVEVLAKAFAINHFVQTIEHVKFFYGDIALYSQFFKRTSGAAGTKKFCNNDHIINAAINNTRQVNAHDLEYELEDSYDVVILEDANVSSNDNILNQYIDRTAIVLKESGIAEELIEERATKLMNPYGTTVNDDGTQTGNMVEADAQAIGNMVFFRHMAIKSSTWNFATQEKQYEYEMAYMYVDLHNRSLLSKEKAVKKYGRSYDYKLSSEELAKYNEILKKGNPEEIINIQKIQYFGNQRMENLHAPTFHKTSLAPLTWRIAEGTNLEDKLLSMHENKIGYMIFESGVKVGAVVDEEGKSPAFYDKAGNSPGFTNKTVKQTVGFEHLGIQVELAPKAKKENTFGSQFRKLFESNLFENGKAVVPELEDLHHEYVRHIKTLVDKEWNKLLKDLKIELDSNNILQSMNVQALVDLLKKESESRQLADNLIESLQVNSAGELVYPIDSLVTRTKLESLMVSIVNSRVIRQTMPGDSMVQLAITGTEQKGKRVAEKSGDLLPYRVDPETGKTLPVQVKVPLNAQYKELLKKYGTLKALNAAIKEDPTFDKRLITLVGYRIPTQGLNSIEFMEIVEFIPETHGASIILPSEVVAKSGGDFDIDKLNIFRPNFSVEVDKTSVDYISFTKYINKGLDTKYTTGELQDLLREDEPTPEGEAVKAMAKNYEAISASQPKVLSYIENTDSRAGIQNRIIEIAKTILEHPYMFTQLITPNSTIDMDELVNTVRYTDYVKAQAKAAKPVISKEDFLKEYKQKLKNKSATEQLMVGNIMNQFRDFMGGKAAVGADAINITGHQLFVQAGTKIEGHKIQINFEANKDEDENYLLGNINNVNKKPISDISSQITNLHLDAAKDPKYKDINLTQEVLGVAHFLNHLGVAEDTIIYFIKQPIILELLLQEKQTVITKLRDTKNKGYKEKPAEKLVNELAGKLHLLKKEGKQVVIMPYDITHIDNTNKHLLVEMLEGKPNPLLELQMLQDFINYREAAKEVGEFLKLVNYDTNHFGNLAQLNERLDAVKDLSRRKGTALLTIHDYQNILDKTIVGAFDKARGTYNMFAHLFLTEAKEIKEARQSIIDRVNPYGKLAEKLPHMINNDFINYITQRFGTYKGQPIYAHINHLFYGKNSLASQLQGIKKIVGNNVLLDQLQGIIENDNPHNISIYTRKLTTNESNVLTAAYRELSEYEGPELETIQKFVEDLTTFGILQSGLHNSPITFLSLIPYNFYGDLTKQAIDNYKKQSSSEETRKLIIDDFKVRFFLKNANNSSIVPNARSWGGAPIKSAKNKLFTQYEETEDTEEKNARGFKVKKKTGKLFIYSYGELYELPNVDFKKTGHKLQNFYLQDYEDYLPMPTKEDPEDPNNLDDLNDPTDEGGPDTEGPKGTPTTTANLTPKASIPQNLVSGVKNYGVLQEANAEAKQLLGKNPHSIDMVEAGIRTRTTRSAEKMKEYNLQVGDILKQFGTSADGSVKNILTKVTAIHVKGSPGYTGTWAKEGWTAEGVKEIDRMLPGAAAIEFEVINTKASTITTDSTKVNPTIEAKVQELVKADKTEDQIALMLMGQVSAEELKNSLAQSKLNKTKPTNKKVVVPQGAKDTNLPIFEDANNVYLMNDGQQQAYDFISNKVNTLLTEDRGFHIEALEDKVKFDDKLRAPFNDILPQVLWNNMIGLAGRGGTGKTTVIKKIIEDITANSGSKYNAVKIHYLTPTHNAATVLQESLGVDSEGVDNGQVSTISSMVRRRPAQEGSIKDPGEELLLISSYDYIESLKYKPGVGNSDIIIVDESSMVTKKNIKDILFRLENEYNKDNVQTPKEYRVAKRMPIFIFMGDYRQLGPIGETKSDALVNKGIISATLLRDKDKSIELTQVMRSKEEVLHQIYDSVGEQIVINMDKLKEGQAPVKLNFQAYDKLTSKSHKNILVVDRGGIPGVIDDYTDYLVENNNPYGMFWIHYNNSSHADTTTLATQIRKDYFKKLQTSNIITKKDLVESKLRKYFKGDYVEYSGSTEIPTHNVKNLESDFVKNGQLVRGQLKPKSRYKVLDIVEHTSTLHELVPGLSNLIRNFEMGVEVTILYNRQNKTRGIMVPQNVEVKIAYANKRSTLTFINTLTKEILAEQTMHYGEFKKIENALTLFKGGAVSKQFIPSYIGSAHTAQGASIKNVIAGDYNIKTNAGRGVNQDDIFSALYTTLTRTSGSLVIIKNGQVEDNQDVFEGFVTDKSKDETKEGNSELKERVVLEELSNKFNVPLEELVQDFKDFQVISESIEEYKEAAEKKFKNCG
jgi:hypothetical protein